MSITDILDIAGIALILLGACLSLIAAIGLIRFPDLLTRMHSATKPQVLGLVLIMTGLALKLRDPSSVAILFLVVVAQMVTSPVASHMAGRASYRSGQVRRDLLIVDELGDAIPRLKENRGAP